MTKAACPNWHQSEELSYLKTLSLKTIINNSNFIHFYFEQISLQHQRVKKYLLNCIKQIITYIIEKKVNALQQTNYTRISKIHVKLKKTIRCVKKNNIFNAKIQLNITNILRIKLKIMF